MLFEHALLLIGIPLILIVLGVIKNYSAMVISGGIALLVVGVLVLASPLIANYDVNYTAENSYVWDGYCNVTDLFPSYQEVYPDAVSTESGVYVSGALEDVEVRDQTYLVYADAVGAGFNITWNFSWIKSSCPEHMHWVGRYEGKQNSYFEWWVFNWTSDAWQFSNNTVVDEASSDAEYQYGQKCNPDFINDNTTQLRLKMVTYNQGSSDEIYTDKLLIHSESIGYAVSNKIIECTRDQYNTTYIYSGESLPANDNLIFGVMLTLVGLLCLVAGALSGKE